MTPAELSNTSALWSRLSSPTGRSLRWLVGERIASGTLSLSVVALISRDLGPTQFGTYSFAVAVIALATMIVQLASPLLVQELIAHPESERSTLAGAARLTAGLVALAIGVIAGFTSTFLDDSTTRALVLVMGLSLLAQPILVLDFWLQARRHTSAAVKSRLLGGGLAAAAAAGVVANGGGLIALGGATLLAPLATSLAYTALYRRSEGHGFPWAGAVDAAIRLVRRAAPLTVGTVALAVYLRVDQVMLAGLASRDEVGIYAATVRISEIAYFFPVALTTAIGPSVARARIDSEVDYRQQLRTMFAVLTAVAVAFVVTAQLIGPAVIDTLYGPQFARSSDILSIHVLGSLFVFFAVGDSLWSVNENRERLAMYRSIAGAVTNIALNFALIPAHGAVGAAWSTVISYAVVSPLGNALQAKNREVLWMQLRSLSPLEWLRAIRTR